MLIGRILNSDATLNNYEVISSVSFISGGGFRLVLQLMQEQKNSVRYFPAAGATLQVYLQKTDGTSVTVDMTALQDLSIWYGDIADADTVDLVSGNFTFALVEGPKTSLGWVENGLALVITGDC